MNYLIKLNSFQFPIEKSFAKYAMLFYALFLNDCRSLVRNKILQKNLFWNVISLIALINFIIITILIWINIDIFLAKLGSNLIQTINALLIWYFVCEISFRLIFQTFPMSNSFTHLQLRVNRSYLIYYMLIQSLFSIYNLIPLLIVVPIIFRIINQTNDFSSAVYYSIGLYLVIIIDNFIAFFCRFLISRIKIYAIIVLFGTLIFIFKDFLFPKISLYSHIFGILLLQGSPIVFFLLIIILLFLFYLKSRFLREQFYLDFSSSSKKQYKKSGNINFLHFLHLGEIGYYISIELNLLIRNKKPRQMFSYMPLFILYCLAFTYHQSTNELGILILNSLLLGFVSLIYGQYLFTWESSYFDGIITRKNNFISYLKAKYYLMLGLSSIYVFPFLLTLILTHGYDTVLLSVILIFIFGVNCFLIMYLGTYNDGRINLGENHFTGHQSLKGNQFIAGLIFNFIPVGFYILFKQLFNEVISKWVLFICGIIFIISNDWWIRNIIAPNFHARKYRNLEGYRKLTT